MMKDNHKRKLGFFEKFYVCRNVENYPTHFNVTGQYNRVIDKTLMSNALRGVILKNPSFALNVYREGDASDDAKKNGDNFTVQVVQRIVFDDIVTFRSIDSPLDVTVLKALEKETCPVGISKPLWRIVVFESSIDTKQYVTLICDHTFFDGNGGPEFHKDLIVELEHFSKVPALEYQDTLFDYVNDGDSLPSILPSSDKIVDLYNTPLLFTMLAILQRYSPKLLRDMARWFDTSDNLNAESAPLYKFKPTEAGAACSFCLLNISPEDMGRILTFCKLQNTTLTPYFTSVALYTLQEIVFPRVTTTPCSFDVSIPVNGKRYYRDKLSDTKYGLYVGQFSYKMGPIPKSLGTSEHLVRPISILSTQLAAAVASRSAFAYTGLLKYVNSWNFLRQKLGLYDSRATIEVSNLGLDLICSNSWSVDNLWFSQSCGIMSSFCFSLIATKQNGLNIVLSYLADLDEVHGPLGAGIMEEFTSAFKNNLLEYV